MPDEYIKIAGQHMSDDIKKEKFKNADEAAEEFLRETSNGNIEKAKRFGSAMAKIFLDSIDSQMGEEDTSEIGLKTQKSILMAFSVFVGFERINQSKIVSDVAQSSFLKSISEENPELYIAIKDTGSLSFYYLAYRRGIETVRRIGQTFAMLCMHDGDSIYQELGEAIYCWFNSVVDSTAKSIGF